MGDIFFAFRGDSQQLIADAKAGGEKAGVVGGKSFGQKFKEGWSKESIGKGILQGIGIGSGVAAFGLVKDAVGVVAGAISDSVDAAKQFDDQLRTINTVAGVSDAQLQRIGDRIQELSRETGKSTDDLTAGFYDLVSAGIPVDKAIETLRSAAILATGALGTTGEAVDLLTSALNAYGLDASQATRVTDIFAAAVRDGKVTAAELGSSLAQVAPIAAAAGVSLEEVAAGYAQLTKNGVPAAQAATQMRQAISALLTPNATLAKIQKDVNVNFAELARSDGLGKALQTLREAAGSDERLAKALGSVEGLSFALLTTGDNAASFATELHGVTQAADEGGLALQQYTEKSKSLAEREKRTAAEVKTLMQDVGALITPIYQALVGGASLVIQTIRKLGDAFHDFERFLSPHLALFEDTDRALIDLAQKYGINEDALLSFAAAQRAAQNAIGDTTSLTGTLQRAIQDVAEADKDKWIVDFIGKLKDLAAAAGRPLEEVLFNATADIEQNGLSAASAANWLDELARSYGLVTDGAGQAIKPMSEAQKILNDFLALPENAPRGLPGYADDMVKAVHRITGETGTFMQALVAGIHSGAADVVGSAKDAAAEAADAIAQYQGWKDAGIGFAFDLTGGVREGVKKSRTNLREAMLTLRAELNFDWGAEAGYAMGDKFGNGVARGLKSKDPDVRAESQGLALAGIEAIVKSGKNGPHAYDTVGRLLGELIASGMTQSEAEARLAGEGVSRQALLGVGKDKSRWHWEGTDAAGRWVKGAASKKPEAHATGVAVADSLHGGIQDVTKNAYTWGSHFLATYLAGIRSMYDETGQVALRIGQILGKKVAFSVPDPSSPLADAREWGQHFVETWVGGILGAMPAAAASISAALPFGDILGGVAGLGLTAPVSLVPSMGALSGYGSDWAGLPAGSSSTVNHGPTYNVNVQGLIRAETPEDIGRTMQRIGRLGNGGGPAPVRR